jgi:transposase
MSAEIWAEIRRRYYVEGLSQRRIAKFMKICPKTVHRAIKMEHYCPKKTRIHKKASKLDGYKQDIAEFLEEFKEITGKRILEKLKKRGYTGGSSILQEYLYKIRKTKRTAYLRLTTLPGEQAQVDWADCGTIKIGEHSRKLSCFVMVLSYSRMIYLEFTLSQRIEDFLRCHINAFRFFGGVSKGILYDNLKSVVLARSGREIRFNPKFEAFRGHYMFESIACNVRAAHEKGRVERSIGYIRQSFLNGRNFKSYTDLKYQSIEWRNHTANVRIHGTTHKRPVDLYPLDKKDLLVLPENDYDTDIIESVKSSRDCYIKFDTNSYLVPYEYAGRQGLTLRASPDKVSIYDNAAFIAYHQRSYEKYISIKNPQYEEELLRQKKKARASQRRDHFSILGEECAKYLQGMVASELNLNHHMEKIFQLIEIYGKTEVLGAVDHALKYKAFGWDYIKNIILQKRARRGETTTINSISIMDNEEFARATVEQRDLKLYDNLFTEEE